jgi:hypothetical protein
MEDHTMEFTLAGPLATGVGALLGWLIAHRGYRLGSSSAISQWRREIRTWADEAIGVLAKAGHSTTKRGLDAEKEIDAYRVDLSSLIDRGRFFLPNEQEEEIDIHKPCAYRGLRHRSLDALMAAYRVLGDELSIDGFPDKKTALFQIRREFVSILQAIIEPRYVNREIARLRRLSYPECKKDTSSGGLLPNKNSEPAGAEVLLSDLLLRYQGEQEYDD